MLPPSSRKRLAVACAIPLTAVQDVVGCGGCAPLIDEHPGMLDLRQRKAGGNADNVMRNYG